MSVKMRRNVIFIDVQDIFVKLYEPPVAIVFTMMQIEHLIGEAGLTDFTMLLKTQCFSPPEASEVLQSGVLLEFQLLLILMSAHLSSKKEAGKTLQHSATK